MQYRLLLIEDSPTQLMTITRVLESHGYTVLPAKSGAEGLARAYYEYPDIIVSDVVMSGINGYQLCRLIKNEPDLAQTPVILLTKLDGSIDRFWGLKSGADRYIPKEPGFNSLIAAVREILGERTQRPKLKVLGDKEHTPTAEEINSRLHQLLERLLFEATLVDEVRKIGEDIFDLGAMAQKLFALLSSILNYQACALMVNHTNYSTIICDVAKTSEESSIKTYVAKLGTQLGLPALAEEEPKTNNHISYDNSLTQPIDSSEVRLGLLVVIPYPNQSYKPGDQKVIRLVCEQLSSILRLHMLYLKRNGEPVSSTNKT